MNYYTAKQRKSDGKWEYTRNDFPVGYCRKYQKVDPEKHGINEQQYHEYEKTSHKHHNCGHDTEQEARECYKQYLLDHNLTFDTMSNQQNKCRVCQEWTQKYAEIGNRSFVLCDEHCNVETVGTLFSAPEQSWSSW